MEQNLTTEWSFLKAPYEELSSKYKTHKCKVEKELSFVLSHLKTMKNHSNNLDRNQSMAAISALKSRLQSFSLSLPSLHHTEDEWLSNYESRLNFISSPSFSTTKLSKFLIDYFTRQNKFEVAQSIASEFSLQAYSDLYFFQKAEKIMNDLKEKDLSLALEWCNEHKSKLHKIRSRLEFELKLQKFLEFVKVQNYSGGILYARGQLSKFVEYREEIQKALMLLLVGNRLDEYEEYRALTGESRWDMLIELFKCEMKRVYGFTTDSLIEIYLRAGIISIKTPLCEKDNKVRNCPTCNSEFQKLGKCVPYACHSHTSIICRILGTPINEFNPPVVLPNGQLYSEQGAKKIVEDEKIRCPVTGSVYSVNQISKVFIL